MHIADANRYSTGSSIRAGQGVRVYDIANFARKLQKREWVVRHRLNEAAQCWSLVTFVPEEVHTKHAWTEMLTTARQQESHGRTAPNGESVKKIVCSGATRFSAALAQ